MESDRIKKQDEGYFTAQMLHVGELLRNGKISKEDAYCTAGILAVSAINRHEKGIHVSDIDYAKGFLSTSWDKIPQGVRDLYKQPRT